MHSIVNHLPHNLRVFLRQLRQNAKLTARRITLQNHVAPDFIIIGSMKAGTTSLFHYLDQHPNIHGSEPKEVHYFDTDKNYKRGPNWYKAHFPLSKNVRQSDKIFEASPRYIYDPRCAKRIHNLFPDIKLIAILRNPVERSISHYFHEQEKGREHRSLIDAIKEEEVNLNKICPDDYESEQFVHFSYKKRSDYEEQLRRYYDLFPEENLLVLRSEELLENAAETLKSVYDFIGMKHHFIPNNLQQFNVSHNRTKVDHSVYEELEEYFSTKNHSLEKLVGRKFSWVK